MKVRMAGAAFAALLSCGCATVTRGTHEVFVVNTEPSGAHVTLSTGQVCDSTPCTFEHIARKAEFSVTISKPGYVTSTHAVTHRTAGGGAAGMAGNVILGGIIGAAVDANSGATQELIPNPLNITLERETAVASAPADSSAAAAPASTAPAATAIPAATPAATAPTTPATVSH